MVVCVMSGNRWTGLKHYRWLIISGLKSQVGADTLQRRGLVASPMLDYKTNRDNDSY